MFSQTPPSRSVTTMASLLLLLVAVASGARLKAANEMNKSGMKELQEFDAVSNEGDLAEDNEGNFTEGNNIKRRRFKMKFGAFKLDGMQVSSGSVKRIAKKLKKGNEELLAFMETDTDPTEMGLWSQLRQRLADEYEPSDGATYEMTAGRYYALSIFVRKEKPRKRKLEFNVEPRVDVCCRVGAGAAKGLLLRNVFVGETGMLLVIGFGLDSDDEEKAIQIQKLSVEIERRKEEAALLGRTLQVVAAGDINTRLVLPQAFTSDEVAMEGKKKESGPVMTRRVTESSMKDIVNQLVTKRGREEMLNWDAATFSGTATDGDQYEPHPALVNLNNMFYFMMDWWRDEGEVPEMITYKRKPWFDRMDTAFVEYLGTRHIFDIDGEETVPKDPSKLILTSHELEDSLEDFVEEKCGYPAVTVPFANVSSPQKTSSDALNSDKARKYATKQDRKLCQKNWQRELQEAQMLLDIMEHNEKDWIVKEDTHGTGLDEGAEELLKDAFFGMEDKVAKTGARSGEAQRYLNHNHEKRAIYMQMGWLDAVGISRDGFPVAAFKDFDTELDVWAFDHTLVYARLQFAVDEPKKPKVK